MKKQLLYICVIAFTVSASAQTLSPSVIASSGNYASGGGFSLSYTVGELAAVQTFSAGNHILTQGFQQPNDILNGLLDIEKGADGAFSVYPVPAQTTLWYGYEFNEAGKVEVSLFNIIGQKMDYSFTETYDNGKLIHNFDCSTYASGAYILSVKFTSTAGQEKIISKKIQLLTK